MYYRDTTDGATEHIAGLSRLTKCFASYTRITNRTPEILSGITLLEHIELCACPGVTNPGIAAMARLPRLRELHLSGMQNLTRESLASFPASVEINFTP